MLMPLPIHHQTLTQKPHFLDVAFLWWLRGGYLTQKPLFIFDVLIFVFIYYYYYYY